MERGRNRRDVFRLGSGRGERRAVAGGEHASRKVVSTRASRKAGSSRSHRKNGSVVWMPATSYSANRAAQARNRGVAGFAPCDQLRHERVVEDRHLVERVVPAIVADAGTGRRPQVRDAAGRRHEALDPDPPRRRAPRWRDRAACSANCRIDGERIAAGDAELPLHQVETRDRFRDRVLDLQARVHLEEVEPAIGIEQELDRPGVGVADRRATRCAAEASARRSSALTAGEGLSSTTFWWRRCTEHSRSTNGMTVPCRRRATGPRCAAARRAAARGTRRRCRRPTAPRTVPPARRRASDAASRTSRMPFPPPPATALSISG